MLGDGGQLLDLLRHALLLLQVHPLRLPELVVLLRQSVICLVQSLGKLVHLQFQTPLGYMDVSQAYKYEASVNTQILFLPEILVTLFQSNHLPW